jgi:hypothetical protein
LGAKGVARKLLDGGALSLGRARAPARGSVAAPPLLRRPPASGQLLRLHSLCAGIEEGEKERERRAGGRPGQTLARPAPRRRRRPSLHLGCCRAQRNAREERIELGFQRSSAASGFCLGEINGRPSDENGRFWIIGPKAAQAGERFPGPGPGCGLGAGREALAGHWAAQAALRAALNCRREKSFSAGPWAAGVHCCVLLPRCYGCY